MITLSDLTRLALDDAHVQFDQRPGVWFRIHETNRCHGWNCTLDGGKCAGALSLIPVNEPALVISNVHVGADGTYREVAA